MWESFAVVKNKQNNIRFMTSNTVGRPWQLHVRETHKWHYALYSSCILKL